MPADFDTGMFHQEPAWHRMGNVIGDWPGSWDEARRMAQLEWEVAVEPIYRYIEKWHKMPNGRNILSESYYEKIGTHQRLYRDDTGAQLAIQPQSYAVIGNGELGQIIEYVMNNSRKEFDIDLKFDTVVSLKGGTIIAVTLMLGEEQIGSDPSPIRRYIVFFTKHDGTGGLKCGFTNVRVVCWNTQQAAENEMDRRGEAFTIRHTKNWATKLEEAREAVQLQLKAQSDWAEVSRELQLLPANMSMLEDFLDKWAWTAISTQMSDLQLRRRQERRDLFRNIYFEAPTTEGIRGNRWGILQAAIEVCDHHKSFHSDDTLAARQLIHGDTDKASAMKVVAAL